MAKAGKNTRDASPYERFQIGQAELGLLNSVAVGAVYEIEANNEDGRGSFDPTSAASFYGPLTHCIWMNPYLSCVVRDSATKRATYERVVEVNLEKHVEILRETGSIENADAASLESLLPGLLDQPFSSDPEQPQWRIVVAPLSSPSSSQSSSRLSRFLLVFLFRHFLADGTSGLNFHRNFLTALKQTPSSSPQLSVIKVPQEPLPAPYDTPTSMPISWGYLAGTIAQQILPPALVRATGLRTPFPIDPAANWTGARPFRSSPSTPERTGLRVFEISSETLDRAVSAARSNGAKLTAVFHQLILRALAATLPAEVLEKKKNFMGMTGVNMRATAGVDANAAGDFAATSWEEWDIIRLRAEAQSGAEIDWASAAATTRSIAAEAGRMTDQPQALLRYAGDIQKLQKEQLGKPRQATYLMSNLGVLKRDEVHHAGTGDGEGMRTARITKALFATPAWVSGGALVFDLVTVEGREMVCVVSWQTAGLGVGLEREGEIVDEVCRLIKAGLEKL